MTKYTYETRFARVFGRFPRVWAIHLPYGFKRHYTPYSYVAMPLPDHAD